MHCAKRAKRAAGAVTSRVRTRYQLGTLPLRSYELGGGETIRQARPRLICRPGSMAPGASTRRSASQCLDPIRCGLKRIARAGLLQREDAGGIRANLRLRWKQIAAHRFDDEVGKRIAAAGKPPIGLPLTELLNLLAPLPPIRRMRQANPLWERVGSQSSARDRTRMRRAGAFTYFTYL
jgi:hypothetical protein